MRIKEHLTKIVLFIIVIPLIVLVFGCLVRGAINLFHYCFR